MSAHRAIFARQIDADHRLGHGFAVAGLPAHSRGLRCRISTKMSAAPASEKSALKPASEMPNSVHCAVSQRTSGAFMICANTSSPVPEQVAVHAVAPAHQ